MPYTQDSRAGSLAELQQLLVGKTVLAVEKPDSGVDECFAKLTTAEHVFHLHATDLGFWVSGVRANNVLRPDNKPLYLNVREVLGAMVEHLDALDTAGTYDGEHGGDTFEAVEDVLLRALGFRCRTDGRAWWFSITTARTSAWARDLSTPEGRAAIARHVGVSFSVPKPTEVA